MNTRSPEDSPDARERIRTFIESTRFEQAITALILANAVTLGLESSPAVLTRFGGWFHLVDRAVLAVFVAELLARLFVYRGRFAHDPWRVFDLAIVGIAVMPVGGAISVLRALRVLRMLRLVSLVPSVRGVASALLSALPAMASILA